MYRNNRASFELLFQLNCRHQTRVCCEQPTTNYLSLNPYRSQLRSPDFKTPVSHESQWFASSFRTVACGSEGSEKLSHRGCCANPTEEQHQWQEHRPADGCIGGHKTISSSGDAIHFFFSVAMPTFSSPELHDVRPIQASLSVVDA